MKVQDIATPRGGPSHAADQRDIDTKALFNGAIQALLADGAPHERVSQARGYLEKLQRRKDQIAAELVSELGCIVDNLDKRIRQGADHLSSDDEQELTERLFSLYLDVSEGMLI
jgi:hypothetical protein